MKKKSFISFLVLGLPLVLCSCSAKNDLSGSYTIDEFLDLIKPAREAGENAVEQYATDEEANTQRSAAYYKALHDIGFKDGDSFTVNGKIYLIYSVNGVANLSICGDSPVDSENLDFISVDGPVDDLGWAVFLENGTNIKVSFNAVEKDDPENNTKPLYFENAQIISPSPVEYTPDCKVNGRGSSAVTVMGKVIESYTSTLSDKEKEEAMNNSDVMSNEYLWYRTICYTDQYVIIEDDNQNRVGAWISTSLGQKIKVGDKIGAIGFVYEINDSSLPHYYLDCTTGKYFVFPN